MHAAGKEISAEQLCHFHVSTGSDATL
jgi:hypothetical protein